MRRSRLPGQKILILTLEGAGVAAAQQHLGVGALVQRMLQRLLQLGGQLVPGTARYIPKDQGLKRMLQRSSCSLASWYLDQHMHTLCMRIARCPGRTKSSLDQVEFASCSSEHDQA